MNPADLTWDPAAEQSVLGSILLSPACLPTVERSLRPADFRLASDRAVYISIHAPREGCDSKLYQRAGSLLGSICLFAQGEEG